MIEYFTYLPGKVNSPEAVRAGKSLETLMQAESDQSYARMMRCRLAGKVSAECEDRYFIALDGEKCVSRIWYGWGRHRGAVGNFGNFRTAEDHQRMGIGKKLFTMLVDDLKKTADRPECLFCTSSKPHLVRLYGTMGFRPALKGTEGRWERVRRVSMTSAKRITVRRRPFTLLRGKPDSVMRLTVC